MKADLVIRNGKVITVDKGFSIKQAVAVKGDKIIAVGSNQQVKTFIGPGSQVLDLKGKILLPGINDAHGHPTFLGGIRPPLALDLSYPAVRSIRDMVETLRKKVEALQPGEWIRGFGWDMGFLEECKSDPTRLPRKWDIDSVLTTRLLLVIFPDTPSWQIARPWNLPTSQKRLLIRKVV
jgi:predicted amidohydrolase YtcJ